MARKVQIDLVLTTSGQNENLACSLDLQRQQPVSVWKRFSLVGLQPSDTIRLIREKIQSTYSKLYPFEGEIDLVGWLKDANLADLSDDLRLDESLEDRERGFVCFCEKRAVQRDQGSTGKRGMEEWISQEVERLLQERLSVQQQPLKKAKISEEVEEVKEQEKITSKKAPKKKSASKEDVRISLSENGVPCNGVAIESSQLKKSENNENEKGEKQLNEVKPTEKDTVSKQNEITVTLPNQQPPKPKKQKAKAHSNSTPLSMPPQSHLAVPSVLQSEIPTQEPLPSTPTQKIVPSQDSSVAVPQQQPAKKPKKKPNPQPAPVAEVTPQKPAQPTNVEFHTPLPPQTTKLPTVKAHSKKMPLPVSSVSTAIPESRPQTPAESAVVQRPVVPPTPSKYQPSPAAANSLPVKKHLDSMVAKKRADLVGSKKLGSAKELNCGLSLEAVVDSDKGQSLQPDNVSELTEVQPAESTEVASVESSQVQHAESNQIQPAKAIEAQAQSSHSGKPEVQIAQSTQPTPANPPSKAAKKQATAPIAKMPFPSIKQITLAKKSVIRSGVQGQKEQQSTLAPLAVQKPAGDYSADLFK